MDLDVLANTILKELGKHSQPVVRGVGAVEALRAVVVGEADEAQVLDAVPFVLRVREDDGFRDIGLWRERIW